MNTLSEDLLASVISWTQRADLLNVRAISSSSRDAVRLAIKSHGECRSQDFFDKKYVPKQDAVVPTEMSPEKAAALGRVFGGGCRRFMVIGALEDTTKVRVKHVGRPRPQLMLEAIRAFHEANIPPGLEELLIWNLDLPDDLILDLCRANPRLVELNLNPGNGQIYPLARNVAEAIGLACPSLKRIQLPTQETCEAEDFAMYFPKMPVLRFGWRDYGSGWSGHYVPSEFGRIEESAERCVEANVCDFEDCAVKPALVECLLRTSLPSRVTVLVFQPSRVSASTLLALATACPKLQQLHLPKVFESEMPTSEDDFEYGSLAFYTSLSQARPAITTLELGWFEPAEFEFVCQNFPLETLLLSHNFIDFASTTIVDIILASPCRDSLTCIEMTHMCATEVLRLVTALETLKDFHYNEHLDPDEGEGNGELVLEYDSEIWDQCCKIMKNRGGTFG